MTSELRDQIEAFVLGRITLVQLYEWLTPRFRSADDIEREVDARVIMGLQHIQDGIESEDDIREQLSAYLVERQTHSANHTIWMRWKPEFVLPEGAGG